MYSKSIEYVTAKHSANYTDEYIFSQLLPYIGNKRKLLPLIRRSMDAANIGSSDTTFVDLFSGTGVVSRYAKKLGYRVISNDWEPYSEAINRCYIELQSEPTFIFGSYKDAISILNGLVPREDWVTNHLCPDDDEKYDTAKDRMFYMRKNGSRIDAIRHQIATWQDSGDITALQSCALLAPLMYQCCYNSNTSGVFKGFHKGWGGQTGTALYRIKGDVVLRPATFFDNGRDNEVYRMDATLLASALGSRLKGSFVYLDPPYNQHPYGSNYHVLNSVALWDKPRLPPKITGHGDKSGIRRDWRTERRSGYNHKGEASRVYRDLLASLEARWVATSYSTDGMIPLEQLLAANAQIGSVQIFSKAYKRYRVSSQRFSAKPLNLEFVVLVDTSRKNDRSVDDLVNAIRTEELAVLADHPEATIKSQLELI